MSTTENNFFFFRMMQAEHMDQPEEGSHFPAGVIEEGDRDVNANYLWN